MLLDQRLPISLNEFNTFSSSLDSGTRPDSRIFAESRKFEFEPISTPGVVRVKLGQTSLSVVTTARLSTPSPNSPGRGGHLIYFASDAPTHWSKLETIQLYFRMLWRNAHVIEEESLCVKMGEKAWFLTTRIIIHVDDSGIYDASFVAVHASLQSLRFPSFDSNTGILYPPTSRRTHQISFGVRPISVTVGFYKENIIIDPSRVEQLISQRFGIFVFDKDGEQLLVNAHMPGDIDEALHLAKNVASKYRDVLIKAVRAFDPGNYCVGSPPDFAGYEPRNYFVKTMNVVDKYKEIEYWYGSTTQKFVLDITTQVIEEAPIIEEEIDDNSDWLFSSLFN